MTKVLRRNFNKTAFREPDPSKPKIVLAYSGGLDTSCQLSWLAKEKGFEVCAYIADLGQDDVLNPKDVEEICAKAEQSGAYAFYCEDLERISWRITFSNPSKEMDCTRIDICSVRPWLVRVLVSVRSRSVGRKVRNTFLTEARKG